MAAGFMTVVLSIHVCVCTCVCVFKWLVSIETGKMTLFQSVSQSLGVVSWNRLGVVRKHM